MRTVNVTVRADTYAKAIEQAVAKIRNYIPEGVELYKEDPMVVRRGDWEDWYIDDVIAHRIETKNPYGGTSYSFEVEVSARPITDKFT